MRQVQRHPVVTDRAAEFPSVAPVATGKPHQHAYTAGSRVVGEDKWGPQQVCFYLLPRCFAALIVFNVQLLWPHLPIWG